MKSHAFTLIELLIAIAIIVFLLMILTASFVQDHAQMISANAAIGQEVWRVPEAEMSEFQLQHPGYMLTSVTVTNGPQGNEPTSYICVMTRIAKAER